MAHQTSFLAVFLGTVIVLTLLHTVLHASMYGFVGFAKGSLSGFVVSPLAPNALDKKYEYFAPLSQVILMSEWMLALVAASSLLIKQRYDRNREVKSINLAPYYASAKTGTHIDVLYAILKDKKQLRLSTVTKVFKVPTSIALDWARILETGNLASLHYPHLGEPSLVIPHEETA